MISQRYTKTVFDDVTILHKVRYEDKKNPTGDSSFKEKDRYDFLNVLFTCTEMWQCGCQKFDKMTIWYENGGWVAELTATERLQPANESG